MSRTIQLTVALMCVALLTPSTPAGAPPAASAQRKLEVADVLSMTDRSQLAERMNGHIERLAAVLRQAVDEDTAKTARVAAERTYLELGLMDARLAMLPESWESDGDDDVRLDSQQSRFDAATAALRTEVARITRMPIVRQQLGPVATRIAADQRFAVDAKADSLANLLQTVRAQVELYRLQHRDEYPDFRAHGWGQLTIRTDAAGASGEGTKHPFGPYLKTPPHNPLTGGEEVLIVRGYPKPDFRETDPKFGFVFDTVSGRLWALDANGELFDEAMFARASVN
jgi:hypothetical protein